jgi:hypothetical protein
MLDAAQFDRQRNLSMKLGPPELSLHAVTCAAGDFPGFAFQTLFVE